MRWIEPRLIATVKYFGMRSKARTAKAPNLNSAVNFSRAPSETPDEPTGTEPTTEEPTGGDPAAETPPDATGGEPTSGDPAAETPPDATGGEPTGGDPAAETSGGEQTEPSGDPAASSL